MTISQEQIGVGNRRPEIAQMEKASASLLNFFGGLPNRTVQDKNVLIKQHDVHGEIFIKDHTNTAIETIDLLNDSLKKIDKELSFHQPCDLRFSVSYSDKGQKVNAEMTNDELMKLIGNDSPLTSDMRKSLTDSLISGDLTSAESLRINGISLTWPLGSKDVTKPTKDAPNQGKLSISVGKKTDENPEGVEIAVQTNHYNRAPRTLEPEKGGVGFIYRTAANGKLGFTLEGKVYLKEVSVGVNSSEKNWPYNKDIPNDEKNREEIQLLTYEVSPKGKILNITQRGRAGDRFLQRDIPILVAENLLDLHTTPENRPKDLKEVPLIDASATIQNLFRPTPQMRTMQTGGPEEHPFIYEVAQVSPKYSGEKGVTFEY